MVRTSETIWNSAAAGLSLASQVLAYLADKRACEIDCARVERMTPSFANAFAMTVLAVHPDAFAARRVVLHDANESVQHALAASIDRYARGIRLSTQLAAG